MSKKAKAATYEASPCGKCGGTQRLRSCRACSVCHPRKMREVNQRPENVQRRREADWRRIGVMVGGRSFTCADFERAFSMQKGQCGICRSVLSASAHADHDHETGAFRGLLCSGCNRLLGAFEKAQRKLLDNIRDYLGGQFARPDLVDPKPDLSFPWTRPETWKPAVGGKRLVARNGVTQHLSAWARDLGLDANTLGYRLGKWNEDRAFAAPRQQTNLRRMLSYGDKTQSLDDWARDLKIDPATLRRRLSKWSLVDALTAPTSRGARRYARDAWTKCSPVTPVVPTPTPPTPQPDGGTP